jgi:hypothetical protein
MSYFQFECRPTLTTAQKELLKQSWSHLQVSEVMVARWHIFKPKILIWVNLEGSCNENVLWPFSLFYSLWEYFVVGYHFSKYEIIFLGM